MADDARTAGGRGASTAATAEPARAAWIVGTKFAASFTSLAFLMAAALVAMPLYLRALGPEAYGLIGFYAVLTAGFQVLDLGLSQTLARECARFRSGALDGGALRKMLGVFEAIFGGVAATGGLLIAIGAAALASRWLRIDQLPLKEVALAISLMGLAVPAQWMSGLYRGAINGLEHQVGLAIFNIALAATRYFGVLLALHVWGARPTVFFAFQACLAILELGLFALALRSLLPRGQGHGAGIGEPIQVKRLVHFSAGIAVASLTWMVLMQGDKAILSKVLPLGAFGVFTLATTATGAVTSLMGPIGQTLLPRLTRMIAGSDEHSALELYRRSTQLACLIALPPAMLLLFFAEPILWIWTQNEVVAHQAAPIVRAYAIGSGLMPLAAFPYYLQYAHGRLRLHVISQFIMLPLLLAGLVAGAINYGAVGAGAAWTVANVACVVIYAPIVHRRFAPPLTGTWLLQDVAPIAGAAAVCAALLSWRLHVSADRIVAVGQIAFAGVVVFAASLVCSPVVRSFIQAVRVRRSPS